MSAILNSCVSCHNAQGLLILALSELTDITKILNSRTIFIYTCTVVAVSITFVVLVLADFPLPDWVYPFLFYIHVC